MTKTQRKLLSNKKQTPKQRARLLREVRRVEADLYLLASALQDDLQREVEYIEEHAKGMGDVHRTTMLSDAAGLVEEYVDAVDALVLPDQKEIM